MLLSLTWVAGCVEPYSPPASGNAPDYLVVDGFINLSGDSASVRLSHTVALSSTDAPAQESGSTVSVEDDSGGTFCCRNDQPGVQRIGIIVKRDAYLSPAYPDIGWEGIPVAVCSINTIAPDRQCIGQA